MARYDRRQLNAAYREAINMPIQSTSSDIVIDRLIEIDYKLREEIGGRAVLTVHDSVVFCVPKDKLEQTKTLLEKYAVKKVREKFPWMPVDFEMEAEYGTNYGECKETLI